MKIPRRRKAAGDWAMARAPEPGDVAHEPEAVEEALRLDGPGRAVEPVPGGKVLDQRAEVGIVARVPCGVGALPERAPTLPVAHEQVELVEQLADRDAKVLASEHSFRDAGGRLREGSVVGRMLAQPLPQ